MAVVLVIKNLIVLTGVLLPQTSSTMSGKVDMKVVMLGQSACGKTSLVERFIYKRFNENYQATIGNCTINVCITLMPHSFRTFDLSFHNLHIPILKFSHQLSGFVFPLYR